MMGIQPSRQYSHAETKEMIEAATVPSTKEYTEHLKHNNISTQMHG